jgi:hypothetical protein
MSSIYAEQARKFVQSARLAIPKTAKKALAGVAAPVAQIPAAPLTLENQTAQALVAGAGLVLAEEGISAQAKHDIVNCTLFAQFHASNVVSDASKVTEWYTAYFSALNRLGWVMTSQDFREHKESGKSVHVHKAVLGLLTALLGAGAISSLAVAKAVLTGMEEMGSDAGWLTLFNQRAISAKVAKFQVVSAQPAPGGLINLGLFGFELKAKGKLTQVLFVKHQKTTVRLRYAGGAASMHEQVLSCVREDLAAKLADAARSFVNSVPIPNSL